MPVGGGCPELSDPRSGRGFLIQIHARAVRKSAIATRKLQFSNKSKQSRINVGFVLC